MADVAPREVTRLLSQWSGGDKSALDRLIPLVYAELHRLAASYLGRERKDHTLQSTALVHEAYLRLVGRANVDFRDRAHFMGVAAQVIRAILVDHARARGAAKRGAGAVRVTLDENVALPDPGAVDLMALEEALRTLSRIDPQQERIVELRFFGGMTNEEAAELLGVSVSTVKREWILAKAWIFRELTREGVPGPEAGRGA